MWQVDDPDRFAAGVARGVAATNRVELWSDGSQVAEAAPFKDGAVTDKWVTGQRRTLSLTVPPTRKWLQWLDLPGLELRPYRGLRFSPSNIAECPMGRFPILPPERGRPLSDISFSAGDYYQRVTTAEFPNPTMSPTILILDLIRWLLLTAGLPEPLLRTGNRDIEVQTLLQRRNDALVNAARSIAAEVSINREGLPVIEDVRGLLGAAQVNLLTGAGGTVTDFRATPDWSKVYNVVAASSSAQGVDFDAKTAAITNPSHPAHPARLGSKDYPSYRTYSFSSPFLFDGAQGQAAADAMLPKVAAWSDAHSYTALVDPRIDSGDTVRGQTMTGTDLFQVESVVTPLKSNALQQVTTVATGFTG